VILNRNYEVTCLSLIEFCDWNCFGKI